MGLHKSKNAKRSMKSSRWWSKKKLVPIIAVGVIVASAGTAYAAYQLFGFGTIDAAAATTQGLTVDNATAQLIGTLVPGQTVGAKADVKNPNDYPVTVTGVIVRNSTLSTSGGGDCNATVHVVGSPTTWPGSGGGAGALQALASNVVIPAGQTKTVTVPQAVRQDASGTGLCGIHADFAVRAQTAS